MYADVSETPVLLSAWFLALFEYLRSPVRIAGALNVLRYLVSSFASSAKPC